MRIIYRLFFGPSTRYIEDEDRSVLEGIQSTQGGEIEEYQIEVHVMRGDVRLATRDTADEAEQICEQFKQEAIGEVAQEFHINPVKTLISPVPEGENAAA